MKMQRVSIRSTHPTLFRTYLTFGVISIGLGLNFLLTTPTFNPYHIDLDIIGTVFLTLGVARIVFLTVWRHLALLRASLAAAIGWKIFWGIGTSITFFQRNPETGLRLTSLQLFVLYMGLSVLEFWLLIESPVTVTTEPSDE